MTSLQNANQISVNGSVPSAFCLHLVKLLWVKLVLEECCTWRKIQGASRYQGTFFD